MLSFLTFLHSNSLCNNFKRESQIVTLSLSYRINNYKKEKQMDKETEIDFEEDF